VSVAWGLWEPPSGITGHLGEADLRRIARSGILPMPAGSALRLLDRAVASDRALVAAARLDLSRLRSLAEAGVLPSMFSGLVAAPRRKAAAVQAGPLVLTERLAGVPEEERYRVVLDIVRGHVAAVLGHTDREAVDADRGFFDIGFDSLTAVELRNRLATETGLQLTATSVFDYPTPSAIARYLTGEIAPGTGENGNSGSPDAAIRAAIAAIPLERFRQAGIMEIMLQLAGLDGNGEPGSSGPRRSDRAGDIATMDVTELIQMALDQEDR
jgi:acyl carrier protein